MQYYMHKKSDKPVASIGFLNVQLVSAPSPLPQALPPKKLLTTPAPSPIKVTETPIPTSTPTTPDQPITQSDAIEGIAIPSFVAGPFSGSQMASSTFFNSQQQIARNYQQAIISSQTHNQTEQEAQFLISQLHKTLEDIIHVGKPIPGKCEFEISNQKFVCDTPELFEKIKLHQQTIQSLIIRLNNLGKSFDGFYVIENVNKIEIILTSKYSQTNSK